MNRLEYKEDKFNTIFGGKAKIVRFVTKLLIRFSSLALKSRA